MSGSSIKAFAPATVANVSCGFDVLGFAVENPGDEVEIKLTTKPGIEITSILGDQGKLPTDPKLNSASVSIQSYIDYIGYNDGIKMILNKKMPISSGMGSSAASSVASVFAVNEILNNPLNKKDLLKFALQGEKIACGSAHADNAAASLLGGFILVRSYDPLDIISLEYPKDLIVIVIHPQLKIDTKAARKLISSKIKLNSAVSQLGNIAGLISGLSQKDYNLISRSLIDVIAEPKRSKLITGYEEIKKTAIDFGAIGCGISGSGPSIYALSTNLNKAENIAFEMKNKFKSFDIDSNYYISKINDTGAKIINK